MLWSPGDPHPKPVELVIGLSTDATVDALESHYRRTGAEDRWPALRKDPTAISLYAFRLGGDDGLSPMVFEISSLSTAGSGLTIRPAEGGALPDPRCLEFSEGLVGDLRQRGRLVEGAEAGQPPSGAKAALTASVCPGCLRWRSHVQAYFKQLTTDEDPTLEGLSAFLCVALETVKERSSEHNACCFDWRTVKRLRRIPD